MTKIISLVEKREEVDENLLSVLKETIKEVKSGKIRSISILTLDSQNYMLRKEVGWETFNLIATYSLALHATQSMAPFEIVPRGEEDEEEV